MGTETIRKDNFFNCVPTASDAPCLILSGLTMLFCISFTYSGPETGGSLKSGLCGKILPEFPESIRAPEVYHLFEYMSFSCEQVVPTYQAK